MNRKKDHYGWWVQRIGRNYEFYDVIRIDHFHGFCDYYAIPYGDETAEHGTLEKGPGMDLFTELEKQLGKLSIIAEDLGNNTPGTGEGNWQWRLAPNFLSEDLARSIRALTELYSRIPKVEDDKETEA